MIPTITIPSLSGTLAKRKEPLSPSHSIAMTEKHCSKIETFELIERKQPAYNTKYKILGR